MKPSSTDERIFAAAESLFLNKGKDGVTMQDIADTAGINKAMLHYYFRSKDGLYKKVFNHIIRKMQADIFSYMMFKEEGETPSFKEILKRFIDRYLDVINDNQYALQFVLWELRTDGSEFVNAMTSPHPDYGFSPIDLWSNNLNKAINSGEIKPVKIEQLLPSLFGTCAFVIAARPLISGLFPLVDMYSKEYLEERKEHIFNLVWSGIAHKE